MTDNAPDLPLAVRNRILGVLSTAELKERILTPVEIKAVAQELLKVARE